MAPVPHWVYVLWSEKLQKRYVGSTKDVESRLKEHNSGKTPFTSRGIPWTLIHKESCASKQEALRRERFLKSGVGRKWLDDNVMKSFKSRGQHYRGF